MSVNSYDQRRFVLSVSRNESQWWRFSLYFEPKDGLHWVRPDMGLVEYDGSTKNNLLPDFPSASLACSDVTTGIFIDSTAPAQKRY
jgi:hypothetical protein